jgi:hypothetical protein
VDSLDKMRTLFGNKNLTWNKLAEYGDFLKGFDSLSTSTTIEEESNYDEMAETMSGLMSSGNIGAEELGRQASVFQMITNERYY